MYVIKKIGLFRRLWHVILTIVFKKEVTVFCRSRDVQAHGNATDNWLVPHWLCPGCLKYQPWDFGAADEYPDLCDNCWCDETRKMKEALDDSGTRSV
jgi:hypothetical protein